MCAPMHWFIPHMPEVAKAGQAGSWNSNHLSHVGGRNPTYKPSLLLSIFSVAGSWSQEPELGIKFKYSEHKMWAP